MTMSTAERQRREALNEILADGKVSRLASGVATLPAVPGTYVALSRAAADPNTGIDEITRIIESDPVISLRLLQLVNSAFFGMAQRTASIPKAVSIMGTNLLKSFVASAHMCNALELVPIRAFSMPIYQTYAFGLARLARRLAGARPIADDAFTAGMMLGVGKIVFALQMPALFEQVLERVAETGEVQHRVERELLGTTHAEAGAFLLSTWGIPFPIVECVAFQFHPSEVGAGDCELLALVHAADALTGIITCGEPEEQLDLGILERAGMLAELPAWRRLVREAANADG